MYRLGRAAEYDADDISIVFGILVVRHDFSEGVQRSDASADELSRLAAKVEDNDFLHRCFYFGV